ncbi:MAG: Ig-like domain-containing protein, partial [Hyphomicrobiales bacterium]
MKQISTAKANSSNFEQELEARLEQLFAQLEAAKPRSASGDSADDTPATTSSPNPVVVETQDFVPLRDGGIDGRGAFGGNRLLGTIRQALADDLDLSQALGNERILFQNIADTIEAQNFTPFYEGSATGFFTGDFLSSVSNAGLTGPFAAIAFSPPHLAPLLNESIERLIQTDPFDDILPIDRTNNVETVQPNVVINNIYGTQEDGVLEEQLFLNPIIGFTPEILTPPTNGTIVFNDDGSFVFTPDPDFSGVQVVQIQFIDPNNGSVRIEEIEINVAPVLDVPILVDGATTVNEDNTIPLGQDIDIAVDDATDGSQTLAITLTGIPAGVVVTAATQNGVTLVQQPDGSYVLSGGTPADVLAVLDTLVLDAPEHNADDFVVTISATATEEDGSTETVTANHAVTIVEVVDQPTVVGGEFVTDEDVPVVLTGLGGELVDQDGSETLIFELANVPEG